MNSIQFLYANGKSEVANAILEEQSKISTVVYEPPVNFIHISQVDENKKGASIYEDKMMQTIKKPEEM